MSAVLGHMIRQTLSSETRHSAFSGHRTQDNKLPAGGADRSACAAQWEQRKIETFGHEKTMLKRSIRWCLLINVTFHGRLSLTVAPAPPKKG